MARNFRLYQLGDKLTEQQERWIEEYLKCGDYTTASRNAGYNSTNNNNLRAIGWQNSLKFKDIIEARRKELKKELQKDTVATLTEIFEFWTDTFNDPTRKITDRLKASELLAKAKGGFIEKVEVKKVETDWFIEDDKDDGETT